MLILAHLGVASLIAVLIGLPISFAMIGAVLPDIVDKGLFFIGIIPYGRFISHTIFFGPMVALITFAITRRKYLALSILIGCYLHLLLDVGYFLPLFYPLVKYEFPAESFVLDSWWVITITEGLGAVILYSSVKFKFEILYYWNKVLIWMRKLAICLNCMKRTKKK